VLVETLNHAQSLTQIALKFGLHRSTSSSPNFAPKWSTFPPLIWSSDTLDGKLWLNG